MICMNGLHLGMTSSQHANKGFGRNTGGGSVVYTDVECDLD